jgi:hypothetical protein
MGNRVCLPAGVANESVLIRGAFSLWGAAGASSRLRSRLSRARNSQSVPLTAAYKIAACRSILVDAFLGQALREVCATQLNGGLLALGAAWTRFRDDFEF